MVETYGSFRPRELRPNQVDEVLRGRGVANGTDFTIGKAFGWSDEDTKRVVRNRYEYARVAREYGEGPGSPAHARLEAWRSAAMLAKKRARKRAEAKPLGSMRE